MNNDDEYIYENQMDDELYDEVYEETEFVPEFQWRERVTMGGIIDDPFSIGKTPYQQFIGLLFKDILPYKDDLFTQRNIDSLINTIDKMNENKIDNILTKNPFCLALGSYIIEKRKISKNKINNLVKKKIIITELPKKEKECIELFKRSGNIVTVADVIRYARFWLKH